MMHYVYVLINEAGTVEYVGQTKNPKGRMSVHKTKLHMNKSGTSFASGRFHGRNDISMEVVKEFDTKDEAKAFEGQLKLELGFEWTERTCGMKGGRKHVESGHLAEQRELRKQPVLAFRKDTGEFVGEFPSQIEAARGMGLSVGNINSVLSGRRKQTCGYTFKRK